MSNLMFGVFAIAFLAFLVTVSGIVVPWNRRIFPSRRRALAYAGICFAVMLVSAIIGAESDPNTRAKMAAEAAAKTREDAAASAKSAADAKAQALQEAAADAKRAEQNRNALRSQAQQLWASILDQTQNCDKAGRYVSTEAKRGYDPYRLYPLVKQANEQCMHAGSAISSLDAPAASEGDGQKAFAKAISTCGNAYSAKGIGYGKLQEVIDGETKPSSVAEAKDAMGLGNMAGLGCAAAFVDAFQKVGLPIEALQNKQDSKKSD